ATAKLLSCDTTITKIMLDPNGVPLSVGEAKRFFTPGHSDRQRRRQIRIGRQDAQKMSGLSGQMTPTLTAHLEAAPASLTLAIKMSGKRGQPHLRILGARVLAHLDPDGQLT
ncbi:hypothetical protein P3L18_28425, partial [Gordonia sp. N1V]|nr:hypothetical protein [Gordonia sp. N1V]